MKKIVLGIFYFLLIFVCTKQVNAQSKTKNDSKPIKCAATINFGSPGSGIDSKSYEEVKALIAENKLKFTEKNVGMEGETEICLPLTELKKAKKKEIIKRLKNIASKGQSVSISTN